MYIIFHVLFFYQIEIILNKLNVNIFICHVHVQYLIKTVQYIELCWLLIYRFHGIYHYLIFLLHKLLPFFIIFNKYNINLQIVQLFIFQVYNCIILDLMNDKMLNLTIIFQIILKHIFYYLIMLDFSLIFSFKYLMLLIYAFFNYQTIYLFIYLIRIQYLFNILLGIFFYVFYRSILHSFNSIQHIMFDQHIEIDLDNYPLLNQIYYFKNIIIQ